MASRGGSHVASVTSRLCAPHGDGVYADSGIICRASGAAPYTSVSGESIPNGNIIRLPSVSHAPSVTQITPVSLPPDKESSKNRAAFPGVPRLSTPTSCNSIN